MLDDYMYNFECVVRNSSGLQVGYGERPDFEKLCEVIDDTDTVTLYHMFADYSEELTGKEFKALYGEK